MARLFSRWTQVAIDIAVLALAFGAAFVLRFEAQIPPQMFKRMVFLWPYVVAVQYGALYGVGVPRFVWRYVGLKEIVRIFSAVGLTAAVFIAIRLFTHSFFDVIQGPAQFVTIPLGVIAVDALLVFLGIAGVRVTRRLQIEFFDSRRRRNASTSPEVPTLLVGAGQAGVVVARELANRPDLGMRPVGFVDDDPNKTGNTVHGIKVLGSTYQLAELAERTGARQVLITIANAPGADIRRIKAACDEAKLPAKIIPGIYEIVGGQVNLSRIRNVSIEDLLGREAVHLEMEAISAALEDKVVFVTGAGGSIGSELCRQIARFRPRQLVLVEQAENALFHIHRELVAAHAELGERLVPAIADICDAGRVEALLRLHRPSVVFHAAAHKHVPMMEWNPGEAVRNNVFGTRTLADLSDRYGVSQFVMISTDKAVNPTSVMGATKRSAELYIQSLSGRSRTRFVAVRFGNVLGSAGSVIPIFQEQIARGGPVTVTHPEMKRYFMTIPEACQLVMQAGTMGKGGEIFILDMGEPVKIVDLARDLITLSGFTPGEDIDVEFTGMRPGEKLFEELAVTGEAVDKTRHPKIFVNKGEPPQAASLEQKLTALHGIIDAPEPAQVRACLKDLVPEYTGSPDAEEEPKAAARQTQLPLSSSQAVA